MEINPMNLLKKTPIFMFIVDFVIVAVLFVFFGSWAMSRIAIEGGMMEGAVSKIGIFDDSILNSFSRMWIPAFLTVILGFVIGLTSLRKMK